MFNAQTAIETELVQSNHQKERLNHVLRSIDGLIFSIKMETYQSIVANKTGNGNKAFEYSTEEMLGKKEIFFSLLPPDQLYAITKKKRVSEPCL